MPPPPGPRRGTGRKVVVKLLRRGGALRHGGAYAGLSSSPARKMDQTGEDHRDQERKFEQTGPDFAARPFLGQRGLLELIDRRLERPLTILRVKRELHVWLSFFFFFHWEESSRGSGMLAEKGYWRTAADWRVIKLIR